MATHQEVLQWLENELFDGNLVLGQQLPPVKDLAAIFRVSRSSMRETLKVLEAQGIVKLFDGPGRGLLPLLVREPAAAAGPALQLHMATSKYPLRDVVQTRVLLESWALENASRDNVPLDELHSVMADMDREDLGIKQFHHLYVSFHIALVKSSGNMATTALFTSLRDSIYEYTMALVGRVPLWSTTSNRVRAEHRAICSALEAGDHHMAARLVKEHITYQYQEAGVDPDTQQLGEAPYAQEHPPAPETITPGATSPQAGGTAQSHDLPAGASGASRAEQSSSSEEHHGIGLESSRQASA